MDFRELCVFDSSLQVGQLVEARWTNCYHFYAAQAAVIRVNEASVRVRLVEDVRAGEPGRIAYPAGRELRVPRVLSAGWSNNNGVFPVGAGPWN